MNGPMRAEGYEVVDREGRVRARIGLLHEDPTGPVFGLGIYGTDGRIRAWLGTGPAGPHLAFDQGGDLAVLLGVSDALDTEEVTGPLFVIAADDGTPVRLWPDVLDPDATDEEV